jgi:hypothetical protein
LSIVVASSGENKLGENYLFPVTIAILKSAYFEEKLASENYIGYSRKAVEEKYPNIAYLFSAFELSEKIHAENYKRVLTSLSAGVEEPESEILILVVVQPHMIRDDHRFDDDFFERQYLYPEIIFFTEVVDLVKAVMARCDDDFGPRRFNLLCFYPTGGHAHRSVFRTHGHDTSPAAATMVVIAVR